jgi:hypothetical protein
MLTYERRSGATDGAMTARTTTRMSQRTRQLIVSLIVAYAMFMQNLDYQAIAHSVVGQSEIMPAGGSDFRRFG